MWICSENIRDQTRKLSEMITTNFGRFCPPTEVILFYYCDN